MSVAFLFVSGVLFVVAVLVLRTGSIRVMQANPVTYRLGFPAGLEAEAVTRFLAGLSGLLVPWLQRWLAQPVVTFEIVATNKGIEHFLTTPESARATVQAALAAHLPSVRYEAVAKEVSTPQCAAEYRISTAGRSLRVDPMALSSGLLSSLQPLGRAEAVVVQWLLTPAGPVRPARLAAKGDPPSLTLDAELLNNSEAVTALRAKRSSPLLLAVARIGVHADQSARGHGLLRRVEAPWHASRAPGVHLHRRLVPESIVASRMVRRSVPITHWPILLNVEEATGLLGLPINLHQVPGLQLGGCRLLPVPIAVPTTGTILGTSTFPGTHGRPVAVDVDARKRHVWATGPTGSGKTTLLTQLIIQDAEAGHGLVVLDPKGGDLIEAVVARLPEHRLDDVIVLDAADVDRPVGYNPVRCTPENQELVAEQVLGVMRSIWRASWGPRTDEIVRASLLTLTAVPGMTLAELPALLTDANFRRKVLAQVHDPFGVESFWATYEDGWSEAERQTNAAPAINKARAFTMRARLRGVLGQPEGAVDFGRIIARRQILLVNLAAGRLGTEAAYLLGALLFSGLWDAVSARASLPLHQPDVMAHLDEFQHLVVLPTPAETVLAEARGYGLGLVLSHQHRGQLPKELDSAVRANCRTKLAFQTSRQDAAVLARELGGQLTAEDLMGIAAYEAVVSCFARGATQPPATIATVPLTKPQRPARELLERSRRRWGTDRAEVDAAMAARQQGRASAHRPVGRSRRQP